MIRRYTTPTFVLKVDEKIDDFDIHVTFKQTRTVLTFTKDEIDSIQWDGEYTRLAVTFTQKQSSLFKENVPVEIQVNVMDDNGYRVATGIVNCNFGKNLLEEVYE